MDTDRTRPRFEPYAGHTLPGILGGAVTGLLVLELWARLGVTGGLSTMLALSAASALSLVGMLLSSVAYSFLLFMVRYARWRMFPRKAVRDPYTGWNK